MAGFFNRVAPLIAAMSLAAGFAGTAAAAPTYGALGGPGFFNGSGVPDGNFWTDSAGGVQVGLRIRDRGIDSTLPGGMLDGNNATHTYQANGGPCSNPAFCAGAPKADWNYDLSVNVGAGDSLSNYVIRLFVDTDPGAGTSFTMLNVLTNWGDNSYWDGSENAGLSAGDFIVQQSANPRFGDSGFGFLPGAGLYDIMLAVYDPRDLANALVSVTVQADVPEPSSLALILAALGGLAYAGRRRKAASKA